MPLAIALPKAFAALTAGVVGSACGIVCAVAPMLIGSSTIRWIKERKHPKTARHHGGAQMIGGLLAIAAAVGAVNGVGCFAYTMYTGFFSPEIAAAAAASATFGELFVAGVTTQPSAWYCSFCVVVSLLCGIVLAS